MYFRLNIYERMVLFEVDDWRVMIIIMRKYFFFDFFRNKQHLVACVVSVQYYWFAIVFQSLTALIQE